MVMSSVRVTWKIDISGSQVSSGNFRVKITKCGVCASIVQKALIDR